jgi:hypothetical protein
MPYNLKISAGFFDKWRRVSYIRNKFWDEHDAIIIITKYKTLDCKN